MRSVAFHSFFSLAADRRAALLSAGFSSLAESHRIFPSRKRRPEKPLKKKGAFFSESVLKKIVEKLVFCARRTGKSGAMRIKNNSRVPC